MNPEGMAAWLYQGDGIKLMEEAYGAFNLVPRPAMAQGPQMAGWFRKKITTIADYKGLRMRVGPFGGKVYVKAGSTEVLIPAAEIYAALERGVIDACEWVGPPDDMRLGLQNTARYYYSGWHETGSMNEFAFNKKAYKALPVDFRRMLDHAAAAINVYGFQTKNAIALEKLKTEFKGKVEILPLPAPVIRELKRFAAQAVNEESEKSPMARKVHASFTKFQALLAGWARISEGAYHQLVAL
jgi:TRAP-type mannitol/chloroaromatic compound transport system substrate-binding protein